MTTPDEYRYELYPLRVQSAEELPRQHSPAGWFPMVADLMVYDDQLYRMPAGIWFHDFLGGRDGVNYVMRDNEGDLHRVLATMGTYQLASPASGAGAYANCYDAFWVAERQATIGPAEE